MVEIFDFDGAIATIEAQIAALEKARNGLMEAKEALAMSGMASGARSGRPQPIAPDAFVGKSIADATIEYLTMVGRPARSTEQITEALNKGGLEHVTQTNVGTMLLRVHNAGGPIVRVSRGVWGLEEWYPRRPKSRRATKEGTDASDEMPRDPELDEMYEDEQARREGQVPRTPVE